MLSVTDDTGVHTIIEDLLSAMMSSSSSTQRWAAVVMLQSFCERSRADYTDYIPQLLRGVIHLTVDTDERVLLATWDCLDAITKVPYMLSLKSCLRFFGSAAACNGRWCSLSHRQRRISRSMFITTSMDDEEKRREQNLIVHSGKSEAELALDVL